MNARTPAAANGEGSGKNVSLVGDSFHVAHRTAEIQTAHLRRRFNLTPAVAAVAAGLAYGQADSWRVRA